MYNIIYVLYSPLMGYRGMYVGTSPHVFVSFITAALDDIMLACLVTLL